MDFPFTSGTSCGDAIPRVRIPIGRAKPTKLEMWLLRTS